MPWDSTKRILRQRASAGRLWRAVRLEAHHHDNLVTPELPAYFIDRYGFRCLLGRSGGHGRQRAQLGVPERGSRNQYLSSLALPAGRLHGWAPVPGEVTGAGSFYGELRLRWAAFGSRTGLPKASTDLPDARSMTWQQVMDDSVFYPGPPVFRGATFIDALSPGSAGALLHEAGPSGIIDFYCFMLQVHETMHRHQTGEPLLNEVVQAALWSRFLSEESLWAFQRDDHHTLVREADVVDRHPVLLEAAVAARLDTAEMIRSIAADNAYFACCALARRFDLGFMRYSQYLSQLSELLAARTDAERMRRSALAHL